MADSIYTQPFLFSTLTSCEPFIVFVVSFGGNFVVNLLCNEIYNSVTDGPIWKLVVAFVIPFIAQMQIIILILRLNAQSDMSPAIAAQFLRYLVDRCTDDNEFKEVKDTLELWRRPNDQKKPMLNLALRMKDFKHSVRVSRFQTNKVTVYRSSHFAQAIVEPFLIIIVTAPGTMVLNLFSSYISDLLKRKEEWRTVLAFVVPLTVQIAAGLVWWGSKLQTDQKVFEQFRHSIRTTEDYEQLKKRMEEWHEAKNGESETEYIFDKAWNCTIDIPLQPSEIHDHTEVLKGGRETISHPKSRRGRGGVSSGLPAGIHKRTDSVWEFHSPSEPPDMEIIFFHGLQLGDFENAFWKTWLAKDEEQSLLYIKKLFKAKSKEQLVWPQHWLSQIFPNARILSISYNSSAQPEGHFDVCSLGENLVESIILHPDYSIGQNCPVILVGHSLGGTVIKQLILSAIHERDTLTSQADIDRINVFLQNVMGVFYYATPHAGSKITNLVRRIPYTNPILDLLKKLDIETARINNEFYTQRYFSKVRAYAVAEGLPISKYGFHGIVVEESSSRHDVDDFYASDRADHFTVCKATDMNDPVVIGRLAEFINDSMPEGYVMRPRQDQLEVDPLDLVEQSLDPNEQPLGPDEQPLDPDPLQ